MLTTGVKQKESQITLQSENLDETTVENAAENEMPPPIPNIEESDLERDDGQNPVELTGHDLLLAYNTPRQAPPQQQQRKKKVLQQPASAAYHGHEEQPDLLRQPPDEYVQLIKVVEDQNLKNEIADVVFARLYKYGHKKDMYPQCKFIPAFDCFHFVNYFTNNEVNNSFQDYVKEHPDSDLRKALLKHGIKHEEDQQN